MAVIRSGYENSSLHAIWGLVDGNDGVESALVDYENKSIVTFEPFTLDHGEHELNLYLTERPKGGGKEGQFLAQVRMSVFRLGIGFVVFFDGGSESADRRYKRGKCEDRLEEARSYRIG